MASDGPAGGWASGRKSSVSGFQWVSPSPTPAEVERLEACFPDVVGVPVEDLEAEAAGWQAKAILARSFQRWVPAEAYVREFRRAGVQGDIVPISLAFKCHIFRFDDPMACEMILNRPWIVNGQIIGTEPWRPEFIPASDAIPLAKVWIRLPNLPMEFWKEEFLKQILQTAGVFVCADAPTVSKIRGGFARACVQVDLRRPLRPGARIQGIQNIFWQQFAYECMEGICSLCGSIHLCGPCSRSSGSAEEKEATCMSFGPWIAALRQRKSVADLNRENARRAQPPPLKRDPASGLQLRKDPGRSGDAAAEGWCSPLKVARRRVHSSSKVIVLPDMDDGGAGSAKIEVGSGSSADPLSQRAGVGSVELSAGRAGKSRSSDELRAGRDGKSRSSDELRVGSTAPVLHDMDADGSINTMLPNAPGSLVFGAVPGEGCRAVSLKVQKGHRVSVKKDSGSLKIPRGNQNPFANSGAGSNVDVIQGGRDVFFGPLKRARPADCPAPRSIHNAGNRKGKGKVGSSKGKMASLGSSEMMTPPACHQGSGQDAHEVALTVLKAAISIESPPGSRADVRADVSPAMERSEDHPMDSVMQMVSNDPVHIHMSDIECQMPNTELGNPAELVMKGAQDGA